jgi:hypothetical protein
MVIKPLTVLISLSLFGVHFLKDIIVLIGMAGINGRIETRGFGGPLFDHCSLRSNLCRNNTKKTDDGRTLCAKTQTVKSVGF